MIPALCRVTVTSGNKPAPESQEECVREVDPRKPFDLAPHETVFTGVVITQEDVAGLRVQLTGRCHCGGNLIPHKRKKLVWICDRSRWWNRRKHAYLTGEVKVLPHPEGEA